MSGAPGDEARVSVLVSVDPASAFRIFTEEIDRWWRRGHEFRVAGRRRGIIHIEPKPGGRLFESFDGDSGPEVVETGRVTGWEPPSRLVFEWRAVNFEPNEKTQVEVRFEPSASGTQVTVTHRGWSRIRGDHPARHGDHPARHGLDVPAFLRMMGLWWGKLMTSLREHAR
jgi:uncharacterized protein YndB with AHSA1/START domain